MMTRILLIEDDADIREGVRLLLSAEGYEIIEADCGAKGLEQLDGSIDLVILDVMMPGISGIKKFARYPMFRCCFSQRNPAKRIKSWD